MEAVIDRRHPLERIAEAYRHVEEGHERGDVVVAVNHTNTYWGGRESK